MVLMNARFKLAIPKSAAPKLVEVSALIHQHIARQNGISFDVPYPDLQLTHFTEIQETILHIRDTQIVNDYGVL
jgi:hypothetical protein